MKKQFVLISPAQDELAELQPELQDELLGLVIVLERNGTLAPPQGDIVDKEKRIFEIRGHDDGQQARILYYYWNGGNLIYGLVVFVKKTRETPPKEINLARKRLSQLKKGMWR
jgi:phage-related protein